MALAVHLVHMANELLHVVDVVVEVEAACRQGNVTCIFPVCDIHLVVIEQSLDRIAQQGGIVSGERSHHQHRRRMQHGLQRLGVIRVALEAHQPAEGLVDVDPLMDRHIHAMNLGSDNVEFRLGIFLDKTVQQLVTRSHARGIGRQAHQGQHRVGIHVRCGKRHLGKRSHQGPLGFIQVVEHGDAPRKRIGSRA